LSLANDHSTRKKHLTDLLLPGVESNDVKQVSESKVSPDPTLITKVHLTDTVDHNGG
jgi:hypothetical protein